MVDELDANHRRRFGHAPRELEALAGMRRIAARMGVEDHHRGGAAQQALLEDLARVDGSALEAEIIRRALRAYLGIED